MKQPFSYMRPAKFSFFDENDGDGETDLLNFSYDAEAAHGMVERIICEARAAWADLPCSAVRASLWAADAVLDGVLDDLKLNAGGERVSRDSFDIKAANQIDFIHLMLGVLAKDGFIIGDEDFPEVPNVEVTPARFCAAFALRMMFNATREYFEYHEGKSDLRDYYLMQAAVAHGLMKSFFQGDAFSIAGAVSVAGQRKVAKRLANTRWSKDPTQSAKKRAIELWPVANREGWEATEMWRKLTGEGHKVAFTTVQKWMPRLRDGTLR